MAVKYVKDFVFEQPRGFTGSVSHKKPPGMKKDLAPAKPFKGAYEGYEDGGMVAARGMPARAKPNAPARGAARMESPPSVGKRQGYAKGGAAKARMSAAQQRAVAQALARQAAARRASAARPAAKAAPRSMGDREGMGETRGGTGVQVTPFSEAPSSNRPSLSDYLRSQGINVPTPSPAKIVGGPVKPPSMGGKILNQFDQFVDAPRLPGPTINVSPPASRPVVRQTAPATRKAPSTFRGLEPGTGPKGVGPVTGGFSSMDMVYDPKTGKMGPSVTGSSNIGSQNAPYVFNPRHLKKGGLAYAKGAKAEKKVEKVMGEYKRGKLHSGSKKGPLVRNPKQAIAIALSEARGMKKAEGGEVFSNEYMAYGDKKGPYRGSPKKAKMLGRQDRRAREAMEHAEKYAPGKSLDMPDKKAHGGMMRRKMA